jgi:hypothetical protein
MKKEDKNDILPTEEKRYRKTERVEKKRYYISGM